MHPEATPDEALAAATAARLEARALRARIQSAEAHVAETEQVVAQRRSQLDREESDVERLEQISWSSIVSRMRGSHATDVDRERAERDAARYAAREAEVRNEFARSELAALRSQLDALGDTEAAYARALAGKEDWLAARVPQLASELSSIAEQRGLLEAEHRELKEADAAGVAASHLLAAAAATLTSAESWSAWDTFMGGGLVTDMVKHSRIDEVRAQLREADLGLRAFARELADLNQQAVARLELPGGLELFDVVFDNIFSDWAVLRRIQDARAQVHETGRHVRTVVDGLRSRRTEITAELARLGERREQLLTA